MYQSVEVIELNWILEQVLEKIGEKMGIKLKAEAGIE
jgi:hypothetical protein